MKKLPKTSAESSWESGLPTSYMVFPPPYYSLRLELKLLYIYFVSDYLGVTFLFA